MSPPGELAMFLAIGAAAVALLFGPIGMAIGRRLWRARSRTDTSSEIEEIGRSMTAELDDLRRRLAEVEERLDFAERLLAQAHQRTSCAGERLMITREDIQSFLDRLDGGSLTVRSGAEPLAGADPRRRGGRGPLRPAGGDPPGPGHGAAGQRAEKRGFFRQLLEFNARDLVHGSYGLEGEHVVLTDTLELENLDYNEFEASFDSVTLALASHLSALAPYRER